MDPDDVTLKLQKMAFLRHGAPSARRGGGRFQLVLFFNDGQKETGTRADTPMVTNYFLPVISSCWLHSCVGHRRSLWLPNVLPWPSNNDPKTEIWRITFASLAIRALRQGPPWPHSSAASLAHHEEILAASRRPRVLGSDPDTECTYMEASTR